VFGFPRDQQRHISLYLPFRVVLFRLEGRNGLRLLQCGGVGVQQEALFQWRLYEMYHRDPSGGDTIKYITRFCSGGDFTQLIRGLKELIRVLLRKEGRINVNMITCLSQSGRLPYVFYSIFKKNLLIYNSKSVLFTTTNRSQCGTERHEFLL
jgi:hypothetical protein